MLNLFRRHLRNCRHRPKGRHHRACSCPLSVEGTLRGVLIRKSLDIRSWDAGQALLRKWEAEGVGAELVSIPEAVAKFTADARARKLTDATLAKYRVLFTDLERFGKERGIKFVRSLTIQDARDFRAGWSDGAISAAKKLERLRAFLRFCVDSKWLDENPAKGVKPPKVTTPPTLPFSEDQMRRILRACELYPRKNSLGQDNRARIKAFVLLLRYSGLRLGDAVGLERSRLTDGKLFLRTQKTGTSVSLPLPAHVVQALTSIRAASDERFFWSGVGHLRSCMSVWDRSLRRVFKLARIEGGHAHRFRDTFAVSLLEKGVPIEQVAVLLGHSSIRVTEKHYSPWVASRQSSLEAAVMKAWGEGPRATAGS